MQANELKLLERAVGDGVETGLRAALSAPMTREEMEDVLVSHVMAEIGEWFHVDGAFGFDLENLMESKLEIYKFPNNGGVN